MRRVSLYLLCGVLVTLGPVRAQVAAPPLPAPRNVSPEDEKFAALAAYYENEKMTFDQIFAALCRMVISNTDNDPRLDLRDQVRAMWGGLWLWMMRGGKPLFCAGGHDVLHVMENGQVNHGYDRHTLEEHYAQHFIGGGMFEAYFDLGRDAGVDKERIDAHMGDYFDFNKVAVVTMGAQWVDVALAGDAAHTQRWLELWGNGRYTLSKSLPKLHWGGLPIGAEGSAAQVKAVERDVAAAFLRLQQETADSVPPGKSP